ncbi:MAG: hypothetical protein NTV63_01045, partial [Candidatus Woesearchaeota archaeon]|nr:hypothetical protein [Candidatus Woesearchaeota archaeon]
MERQALLDFGTGFFYYASERVKEAAGDNGIKYELPKIRFAEARSYDEEIRYSEIMYKAGIDELLLEGKKFRGKEDWISEMKSVLTPEEFSEKEILEKKLAAFSKGQYNYLTDEITIDNSLVEEIGIEHVLCHEILHSIRHQIRDYLGWDDEYSELISPGKAEFFSQLESVALESYGYRDGNEINPLNLDSLLREKAIFGKGSIRKKISEIKSAYLEAAGKNISKKRFEEQKSIDSGMSDAVKGINLKELIKEKEEMKMLYSAMEQFYNAKDYLMLLKGIS